MKIIKHKNCWQMITMPIIFPINAYLVLEDEFCTLIDCSKKGMSAKIAAVIGETKLPLKYIVLTHAHSDHVGDVAKLKKEFPATQVCLSQVEYAECQKGVKGLTLPLEPDILLQADDFIGSLQVKATPGHTLGSISFVDQRDYSAFVGDLIQTQGGAGIAGDVQWLFPIPAFSTQNPKLATETFSAFSKGNYSRYYCGHGRYLEGTDEVTIAKMIESASK